jgi:hypothetical protein
MKNTTFWDIMPCSLLKVNGRFEETYRRLATCFHAGILLGLFDPEDGGDMFLQEVS